MVQWTVDYLECRAEMIEIGKRTDTDRSGPCYSQVAHLTKLSLFSTPVVLIGKDIKDFKYLGKLYFQLIMQ